MTTPLAQIIAAQSGAITTNQALTAGMTRSQITQQLDRGLWRRLVPGIHLATPTPTWLGYAWAGVLRAGPDAAVGGRHALHLHGLAPESEWPILVQSRHQVRLQPQPWWHFERAARRCSGAPPRVRVEAALLDAWPDMSIDAFVAVLGKAVSDHRTTEARLRDELARRARVTRRRELAAILGDVRVGVRSPLERAYLRLVERPHGLPVGTRQVRTGAGIVDVLLEEWGVVVELDGRLGHAGEGRFRDMRRDNHHTTEGAATLRYGWPDVRGRACLVAAQVGMNLTRRGWPGPLVLCPDCEGMRLTG